MLLPLYTYFVWQCKPATVEQGRIVAHGML
jgi:hypothetical protein